MCALFVIGISQQQRYIHNVLIHNSFVRTLSICWIFWVLLVRKPPRWPITVHFLLIKRVHSPKSRVLVNAFLSSLAFCSVAFLNCINIYEKYWACKYVHEKREPFVIILCQCRQFYHFKGNSVRKPKLISFPENIKKRSSDESCLNCKKWAQLFISCLAMFCSLVFQLFDI